MERIKKARKPVRSSVTRLIHTLEQELEADPVDRLALQSSLQQLEAQMTKLAVLDEKVIEALLDDEDAQDDELTQETEAAQEYINKATMVQLKVNEVVNPPMKPGSPTPSQYASASSLGSTTTKRTCKLPKLEMKKFTGDLMEWLGWWAQYEKIHEDEELHDADKFQYLVMCMVPGTRAQELVDSYPQSKDNYPKVVAALKQRFGNPKLLKQVYVRDLIRMIIVNKNKDRMNLTTLYDKLESHLRSLESLGVTTDQMIEFLYPMVESSLPEDILLAWQRSGFYGRDGSREAPPKSELDFLMAFLKQEIEHEAQRKLAREGFGEHPSEKKRIHRHKEVRNEEEFPTAAGLFGGSSAKSQCIFCEKTHESRDCIKAQTMTLDEKKARILKSRACFVCLKLGHMSKKCRGMVKCIVCGKKHHAIVCPDSLAHKQTGVKSTPEVNVQSYLNCTSEVILQTLMVNVQNPTSKATRMVRALLDSGSQRSYILKDTAQELGLKSSQSTVLNHALFGGTEVIGNTHHQFDVDLVSRDKTFVVRAKLFDQLKICGGIPRMRRGPWMAELKQKRIFVNDLDAGDSMSIEVLIGADILGKILSGSVVQLKNGLSATQTRFGWTLMGQQKVGSRESTTVAMNVLSLALTTANVTELWSLDTIGIRDPVEVKSREEKELQVQQHFMETVVRKEDGRYAVSLPWIAESKAIPSNKEVAVKRLQSTAKKLKDMGQFQNYSEVFQTWLEEGIISKVDDSFEVRRHFLPHRAVLKPQSKTTPVRPVFDASCKVGRSPSLNECLEKGPNLLELIPSILLRFRMGRIGVASDIRKAFLMVEINEPDRNFISFLWYDNEKMDSGTPSIFQHNRVVFGMNCSPFLLGAVIQYHLSSVPEDRKEVAQKLSKSIYVDNCVTSVNSMQDYEIFKTGATELMADAKMELRQWEHSRDGSLEGVSSVLGLKWDKDADTLCCAPIPLDIPPEVTKRVMLSIVHRFYDPLGFLCPVMLPPKLLLQKSWLENRQWNEEVSEELKTGFLNWLAETAQSLDQIHIPRNVTGGIEDQSSYQIHTFSDASKSAYAACVFLRVEAPAGVTVQLLQAKNRVAPVKPVTIPRLELLSCGIAARLTDTIVKALSFEQVPKYFWTDSSTALAWILRRDEWGTFVGNRVKEIRSLSNLDDWHHVPGIMNPADLPSRGSSFVKLLESRWWEGPEWLRQDPSKWPAGKESADEDLVNREKKKSVLTLTSQITEDPWYIVGKSSYTKILRTMALVFRFIDKLKRTSVEAAHGPTPDEVKNAELRLFKLVQAEEFDDSKTEISGLRVVRDESGVIRVKTKLLNRQDSPGFRYPILLPSQHPLVNLMVREEHIVNCHCGVQCLMGLLREKCWIIQARRAIRKIVKSCVICRRFSSRSFPVPQAALPEDRVKDAQAFEITGIDLAGPLVLKNKSKCWITLFTCAVYRCVHLEIVESLSTEDFLLAFIRFCKRKRRPATVYTDNGTNFIGAENLFKTIDWDEVEKRTKQQKINWRFNPPSAPWWGGWWERLIRSVKDLLKRMLGFQKVSYVELETFLCEVESVMNNRPLTYVTEDQDDLVPLTPAMFIHSLPVVDCPEAKLIKLGTLGERRRSLQKLSQELKDRFRKEYLAQLVQRGKDQKFHPFSVGDVVLLEVDKKKRILWPMAKILELIKGKDGCVRVAKLQTKTGTLLRPLQRLFPLEVSHCDHFPPAPKEVQKEVKLEDGHDVLEVRSLRGRLIKKPDRFQY